MTRVALAKWGNNLALRLPKATAQALGVQNGAELAIEVSNGSLVATPVRKRPNLDELVAGINDRNRHRPTDWGQPVGKELW